MIILVSTVFFIAVIILAIIVVAVVATSVAVTASSRQITLGADYMRNRF